MSKFKFNLGDIIRHKAANRHNARKMLVIARGSMANDDGETIMYLVSGEKESFAAKDDTYFKVYMEEQEIELFTKE